MNKENYEKLKQVAIETRKALLPMDCTGVKCYDCPLCINDNCIIIEMGHRISELTRRENND